MFLDQSVEDDLAPNITFRIEVWMGFEKSTHLQNHLECIVEEGLNLILLPRINQRVARKAALLNLVSQ